VAEAERKGQNEDGVRATQIVYCVNSASTLRRFVSVQRTDAHVRRVKALANSGDITKAS